MTSTHLLTSVGGYFQVAAWAFLWALMEIVQTFRNDIGRALRSGWSGLLIGVNIAFALLVYALVQSLVPAGTNPCLLALGVGVGWQAFLRTRINLLQPLYPEVGQAVSLSLADLYSRFQQFCREGIDQDLATGRMHLLERATRIPLEKLEREVRLHAYASVLHSPEEVEAYLDRLRSCAPEQRALLLASYLLREAGYPLLRARLRKLEGSDG